MDYNWLVLFDPHIVTAALLGAALGLEREIAGKDPSLRTFTLICVGSCVFSLISVEAVKDIPRGDPSRIAAQVVSGIGFLGAGAIFRGHRGVAGLTTAALMWVTAGIGMAVAFNRVELAVSATFLTLLVTLVMRPVHAALDAIRVATNGKADPSGPYN